MTGAGIRTELYYFGYEFEALAARCFNFPDRQRLRFAVEIIKSFSCSIANRSRLMKECLISSKMTTHRGSEGNPKRRCKLANLHCKG